MVLPFCSVVKDLDKQISGFELVDLDVALAIDQYGNVYPQYLRRDGKVKEFVAKRLG